MNWEETQNESHPELTLTTADSVCDGVVALGGQWVMTSGSASGDGSSSGHGSFEAHGTYHYHIPGATVSGSATASGDSSTSSGYQTRSTWDPASGGGNGAWVTSGTSSGSSKNTKVRKRDRFDIG